MGSSDLELQQYVWELEHIQQVHGYAPSEVETQGKPEANMLAWHAEYHRANGTQAGHS